jgi:hypothetical protein
MPEESKTYTVELTAFEIVELIRVHTRAINKVKTATGKAITSEQINIMPRGRIISEILEIAKQKINEHVNRAKELCNLLKS